MCSADWKLILEYVRVLMTWPPLAALMLAIFFGRFHKEIRTFLENVRPKLPGTDPLPVQPVPFPPADGDANVGAANGVTLSATEQEHLGESDPSLAQFAPAQQRAEDQYRYLNNLLILPTQRLLDALVERGHLSTLEYKLIWPDMTPEAKSNMLTVLYQNGLVEVNNGQIAVTDRGRAYALWPQRNEWVKLQLAVWSAPQSSTGAQTLGASTTNVFARNPVSDNAAKAYNYSAAEDEKSGRNSVTTNPFRFPTNEEDN